MYLHTGDHVPTTFFSSYPCFDDTVYISNLQLNEYVYSEHPYYIQKDNGLFYGFNDTFSIVYHKDHQHNILNTFELSFEKNCEVEHTSLPKEHLAVTNVDWQPLPLISIAIILGITIFLQRRMYG